MKIQEHLSKLGHRVKDKVTGFEGVVTSISFDLYGCIQVVINPGLDSNGKPQEQHWFDINRLKVLSKTPVMQQPNFDSGPIANGDKGPAEKPAFSRI